MGILLAFAVGYVVGARAGMAGLQEVVSSANEVRASEEFDGMVRVLRSHLGHILHDIGELVGDEGRTIDMDDVVEDVVTKARRLMGR